MVKNIPDWTSIHWRRTFPCWISSPLRSRSRGGWSWMAPTTWRSGGCPGARSASSRCRKCQWQCQPGIEKNVHWVKWRCYRYGRLGYITAYNRSFLFYLSFWCYLKWDVKSCSQTLKCPSLPVTAVFTFWQAETPCEPNRTNPSDFPLFSLTSATTQVLLFDAIFGAKVKRYWSRCKPEDIFEQMHRKDQRHLEN